MKSISKITASAAFLFLLIAGSLFTSCNTDDNDSVQENKLSGEELFRQVYFMESKNNIFNSIPSYGMAIKNIEKLDNAKKIERANSINKIISSIYTTDANYFNKFKQTILNNNPYQISESLKEGAELIRKTKSKKTSNISKESESISNGVMMVLDDGSIGVFGPNIDIRLPWFSPIYIIVLYQKNGSKECKLEQEKIVGILIQNVN